jgi:hypothetical protein
MGLCVETLRLVDDILTSDNNEQRIGETYLRHKSAQSSQAALAGLRNRDVGAQKHLHVSVAWVLLEEDDSRYWKGRKGGEGRVLATHVAYCGMLAMASALELAIWSSFVRRSFILELFENKARNTEIEGNNLAKPPLSRAIRGRSLFRICAPSFPGGFCYQYATSPDET